MMNRLSAAILTTRSDDDKFDIYSVDFLVDGVSLYSLTNAHHASLAGRFSSLWVPDPEADENKAKILLNESPTDLPDNRIGLFVCQRCGSLDCGGITFRLTRSANAVRWSKFAYEADNDYTDPEFARYSSIGPFTFNFSAYREAIERAVTLANFSRREEDV
jgi:hypothetical protein